LKIEIWKKLRYTGACSILVVKEEDDQRQVSFYCELVSTGWHRALQCLYFQYGKKDNEIHFCNTSMNLHFVI